MKKMYSIRQIQEQKIIYWRTSYKTLRKYIDYYRNILKPIKTGSRSGSRYYIAEENLLEFVRMFEQNELMDYFCEPTSAVVETKKK